jgi:hypothetical protein
MHLQAEHLPHEKGPKPFCANVAESRLGAFQIALINALTLFLGITLNLISVTSHAKEQF